MDDTQAVTETTEARPSFEQAFAADASPAPDQTAQTTTPLAAEQPAAAQDTPQPTDDRSPFIPRARFDEVNTRMTTAEARAQKLAWAEQIDQAHFSEMSQWYQRANADPVAFVQSVIAELQAHPEHSAKLRSMAARALAQGRGQQTAEPSAVDLHPIAVELADGRVIQVHTAEQVAAREQQLIAQQDQKYAPALQTAADLKQEREQLAAEKAAGEWSTSFLAQITSLPNYAEVRPKMEAELKQLIEAKQVGDNTFDLENAVRSLYIKHALPLRDATAQSRQLDDLQRKAAASTGINPGSAAPTSPRRPTSFADKSLKW